MFPHDPLDFTGTVFCDALGDQTLIGIININRGSNREITCYIKDANRQKVRTCTHRPDCADIDHDSGLG